jgi:hypothetical protein
MSALNLQNTRIEVVVSVAEVQHVPFQPVTSFLDALRRRVCKYSLKIPNWCARSVVR